MLLIINLIFQVFANGQLMEKGALVFGLLKTLTALFVFGYVHTIKIIQNGKKFIHDKYLLPSSDLLKPIIPDYLDSIGIKWKRAQFYKTVVSDLSDLRDVYYDVLVFFSPSGIESLFKNFPNFKQNNTKIAVYGNTTIQAANNANLRIDIKAPSKQYPSMTMAIEKYLVDNK